MTDGPVVCWYVSMSDPSPSITTGAGPDDDPDPETCVYLFLTHGAAVDWITDNGYGGVLAPIPVTVSHDVPVANCG